MRKLLIFIGFVLLTIGIGLYVGVAVPSQSVSFENVLAAAAAAIPEEGKKEEVTILFAGDIMLSRKIGEIMEERNDFCFPFRRIASTTGEADIAFANLESPVSSRGVSTGSIYSFRADPRALQGIVCAGFDVLSVANNHVWDYGREAFEDTLLHLSSNGIVAVGGGDEYADAHRSQIATAGKTRVAFLAYTNLLPGFLGKASSTPAVSRFSEAALKEDIADARVLADVVAVSFHWGDEYETSRNSEQARIARQAIDFGADLVIGHHPHVVQEVELYGGGYIAYSLGNLVFDQNFSKETSHGMLLLVRVKDGKVAEVQTRQVAFTDLFQPYLAE